MSNQTQIGQLVIDLQIKTKALEQGLETAKKKLEELEKQNDQVKNSNKDLEASYIALSATAVVALAKVSSIIKNSVKEYKAYTQAMDSLNNVSEYTGENMSEFSKIMDKFETYMTKSDIATTIKNFSLMGFTAQQTEQMMEALTNSAIRNRNANYTVSEAVRVASEGYRQGLSTLSDSAGVTENLSVMLDKYAQSIGKTASQLTEAEKNQAYLNRTMYAAEPFANAMSDYLDTLAGKQGQYSQAMRETQVAYAEALEPMLMSLTEMGTQLFEFLNGLIEQQPELISGITTFTITLTALTIVMKGLATAKEIYEKSTIKATIAAKGFTAALATNPIFLISAALAVLVTAITKIQSTFEGLKEKLNETSEAQERLNQAMQGTLEVTDENIKKIEEEKAAAEGRLKLLEDTIETEQELQELRSTKIKDNSNEETRRINTLVKNNSRLAASIEMTKKQISTYEKYLVKANISKALDIDTNKNMQTQAAQLKVNIQELQNYLNIVKQGEIATTEYQEAVKVLAEKYPEASSAGGILIDVVQDLINAENIKAQASWESSQTTIQGYIDVINWAIQMAEAARGNAEAEQEAAAIIGMSYENIIPTLTSVLNVMKAMRGYAPEEVPGTKSTYTPRTYTPRSYSSSSNTYSNKALDNYKKQLEYKKSLDQLSLREEIAGYEYALHNYAKTQDEKQDLTTKIYELRKEAQQEDLDNYTDYIDYKKSLDQLSIQDEIKMYEQAYDNLAKTTEQKREIEVTLHDLRKQLQENELDNYISNIEYKKSLEQLSLQEEIENYEYALKNLAKTTEQKQELEVTLYDLKKQLAEENVETLKQEAEEEKKLLEKKTQQIEEYMELQRKQRGAAYDVLEETRDLDRIIQLHKNYLSQILEDERYSLEERKEIYENELEIIKDYEDQKRELRVQSINDTVSQLASAITKQLEEMQSADKEAIEANIKLVEEWKDTRINAINEEYDARIEAIQKELDLLDKSEQEKTRAEEDAEYERKKLRLEQLVQYEHDATTKANYQKELDKLISDYQNTLDKRALQDKKDVLKEQQDLLKEEQDNKVQAIEEEADKQKEVYENQLDELEKYYDEQISMAQETAEKMLLNVDINQKQILDLLKKYGDDYEITGQSLGEKLAQGINNGIADKIQNIVQKIQDSIDNAINNKISSWAQGIYKYEAAKDKPSATGKSISIQQYNTIQQTPETPSETYRKLNNVSQKLAEEFAGM